MMMMMVDAPQSEDCVGFVGQNGNTTAELPPDAVCDIYFIGTNLLYYTVNFVNGFDAIEIYSPPGDSFATFLMIR